MCLFINISFHYSVLLWILFIIPIFKTYSTNTMIFNITDIEYIVYRVISYCGRLIKASLFTQIAIHISIWFVI